MNDLLMIAIPFFAFTVMLVAWLAQNRKAATVRTSKSVRTAPVTVSNVTSEPSGIQVPA